ncbi:hypothetical protein AB0P16_14710 [Dietzia maris]|uniref:hypothetical protein n=1 Tax=Dietzia maris TaxID=37915 RepID=UPI003412600B
MRLSTKLGASISTAALGAAAVLGGAGVAQAQSLGSLGSSEPDAVTLTVAGDMEGVAGEITNNTDGALTCTIGVSNAEVISAIENGIDDETSFDEANDAVATEREAANVLGQNALAFATVPAGETVTWSGIGSYGPAEDFRAGAAADCGDEIAFAYESGGLFGSLDMGSLGS